MTRKSANVYDVRHQNQKLVLDILRTTPCSRADLAVATGLTRQAISVIVEELLKEAIVIETGRVTGGVGRSPIQLAINGDSRYCIGINITRSKMDIGVTNLLGRTIQRQSLPIKGLDPADCLASAVAVIKTQLSASGVNKDQLLGVGVSAPGPLDFKKGIIHNPPGFKGWHGFKLSDYLTDALGLKVLTENVADAMALEEMYFGDYKDIANFMVVRVDDEIGAGIIIGGDLYRGRSGFGGEIGHTSIVWDGVPCECGGFGCLSRYAAIPELLRGSPFGSWAELVNSLGTKESADKLLAKQAGYLSAAIVSAINLFDLEKVIIGGDLSYNSQPFIDSLGGLVSGRIITPLKHSGGLILSSQNEDGVRTAVMPLIARFYKNSLWH